jgi:hypothetical protein
VQSENDARVLTGRIRNAKSTDEERWRHHVTHPAHLELSPVMEADPVAELLQHIAVKLDENRWHRFVSRQGPGIARFTKEGHEGPGLAIHMEYMRRRGEDDHARVAGGGGVARTCRGGD